MAPQDITSWHLSKTKSYSGMAPREKLAWPQTYKIMSESTEQFSRQLRDSELQTEGTLTLKALADNDNLSDQKLQQTLHINNGACRHYTPGHHDYNALSFAHSAAKTDLA